jgi:hypothetical protein
VADTEPKPKRPPEVVRAQVLTYLEHLGGEEVTLTELADAVGVWHLPLSQLIKPLVARGRVRTRRVDDAVKYRIGAERPATSDDAGGLRLEALERKVEALERKVEALERGFGAELDGQTTEA